MTSELCKECWRFTQFSNKCHFHWKGKIECSRYMEHELDEERYRTILNSNSLF